MKKLNYSIGLDIGTNSVGYACIREDFSVLSYRDRNAIGVHEFEAGNTAEERRVKRGQRRRYNRRVRRIQLLQEVWQETFTNIETINTKSINFFSEVYYDKPWKDDNSFEHRSLKEVERLLGISNTYPTIYHLRQDLMNAKEKKHPWLIYLAIVKFRGHFLNGSKPWVIGDKKNIAINEKL